jgi:hypothetical protein
MTRIISHKTWPALLMAFGLCLPLWGGQTQAPKPPAQAIPEGGANQVQRPVYRPLQLPPRQVTRPVAQPNVRPAVQPARRPVQPAVQPGRQAGNQAQIQRGLQPGQQRGRQPGLQVGNQRQNQPGRQLGRGPQNQPGLGMGGGRSRTVQSVQFRGGGQGQVAKRSNGSIAYIHTNRINIDRGLHGTRRIVAVRNGRTFVATGRHKGYVERPYLNRGGRAYFQRTYVAGGRTYANVYRAYNYHGARYCAYAPTHYYHPSFYGWATHGWGRRVYYTPAAWGWAGAPWYATYNVYFTPYPAYRAPAFWLADFVIAANLQIGFQQQVEAGGQPGGGGPDQNPPDGSVEESTQTPMSPQVKQQVAQEVQRQITDEQQEAAGQTENPQPGPGGEQVPEALNPSERVFVVSGDVDTALQTGQECSLSGGDVVSRTTDDPDANQNVQASVLSSKQGDCATGQTVAVSVQDLQEMHNQLQQQVDSGLETLAQNGSDAGLPQAPDTTTIAAEVPPPAPDPGAANQIEAEQNLADQVEGQVPKSPSSAM